MPPATTSGSARVRRNPNANYGPQLEPIAGINLGTGQMFVNLDCDRRFHELNFQTTAINYVGGAGLAVSNVTVPSAAPATVTLAAALGIPGAVSAISGGATGWVTGNIATIADSRGAGATFTVTASGGQLTALAYNAGTATPSAVNPQLVIGSIQLSVNGSPIVDTTCALELLRALFNGVLISYGQFPIFFTEPWRNLTRWPTITAWDMAGQNTFAVKFFFLSGYTSIGVTGSYEWDFVRNTVQGEIDGPTYQAAVLAGKAPSPLLQVIARHLFTPTLNGGDTIINNIPIGWPILRMHMACANPGTLTKAIINQDGQIVEQGQIGTSNNGATMDQLRERLIQQGFNTTLFDYSYVADKNQRIQNGLKVGETLKLTLTTTGGTQGLTILQERLQSRYE